MSGFWIARPRIWCMSFLRGRVPWGTSTGVQGTIWWQDQTSFSVTSALLFRFVLVGTRLGTMLAVDSKGCRAWEEDPRKGDITVSPERCSHRGKKQILGITLWFACGVWETECRASHTLEGSCGEKAHWGENGLVGRKPTEGRKVRVGRKATEGKKTSCPCSMEIEPRLALLKSSAQSDQV